MHFTNYNSRLAHLESSIESAGRVTNLCRNPHVSGYTISGIFRGFHSGSDNPISLRNAILVNNGNSQSTQVNTLMNSYGWQ